MRYMQIRFTEWRDQVRARGEGVTSETEAATLRTRQAERRLVRVRSDMALVQQQLELEVRQELNDKLLALRAEASSVLQELDAARKAETAAGDAQREAMLAHPMVGKTGYQVINDDGTEVVRICDDAGNDLPAGAVYGYEIINRNPAAPRWAA